MAFEKINLRKGLMARMERKYCNEREETPIVKSLSFFSLNTKELTPINKVKQLTRFSIGKRLNKRG